MEFTKWFSPRSSKSLDHFNFLLGCFIGVLGKRKETEGGRRKGKKQEGERLQTRLGECRGREEERERESSIELRLYQ